MKTFAARRLAAAVTVAVPALVIAACSGVAGTATPEAAPAVTSTRAAPTTSSAPGASRAPTPPAPEGGCTVTVAGLGQISMTGSGGRASTTPDGTSFSCASGPLIDITAIGDGGVTFAAAGVETLVAAGETATVGAYSVTVTSVEGDRAVFQATPS
ncbi:hypothetical protein [Pseudonocardia nigra]|uniref:hypothetical protein n=1 Tax=Pseudonocardia nigra TaxID=1921578 RepID=UPI001C5F990E|nr:hypothetical protein [Pseudonocardia nigra]